MAERIVSYIETEPVLKQASHAKRLQDNPEWAVILGIGYNDTQVLSCPSAVSPPLPTASYCAQSAIYLPLRPAF